MATRYRMGAPQVVTRTEERWNGRMTEPHIPQPSPRPATSDGRPALTGGQRATAILAGVLSHVVFAMGWFGVAFVLLGAVVSPLVDELLRNLLGDLDAAQAQEIIARAGALLWVLGIVFLVGSAALVAFAWLISRALLVRGGVEGATLVTWVSIVVAAAVDLPVFLLLLWLATLVTETSSGLLFLPPVLSLLLSAAVGAFVWWGAAVVLRGRGTKENAAATGVSGTRR